MPKFRVADSAVSDDVERPRGAFGMSMRICEWGRGRVHYCYDLVWLRQSLLCVIHCLMQKQIVIFEPVRSYEELTGCMALMLLLL